MGSSGINAGTWGSLLKDLLESRSTSNMKAFVAVLCMVAGTHAEAVAEAEAKPLLGYGGLYGYSGLGLGYGGYGGYGLGYGYGKRSADAEANAEAKPWLGYGGLYGYSGMGLLELVEEVLLDHANWSVMGLPVVFIVLLVAIPMRRAIVRVLGVLMDFVVSDPPELSAVIELLIIWLMFVMHGVSEDLVPYA